MVAPRRVRDVDVYLGRMNLTIRQDFWHVWVRLHTEDGPEYLAELSRESTSSPNSGEAIIEGGADDLMPPWNTHLYATPKGTVPPLSNELKIDLASIPVPSIAPPPSA